MWGSPYMLTQYTQLQSPKSLHGFEHKPYFIP